MKGMIKMAKKKTIDEIVEDVVTEEVILEEVTEEVTNEETLEEEKEVEENLEEVTEEVEVTSIKTTGVVIANKLNVRKDANKEADVLTIVSKGTGVKINLTESTEDFYCVDVIVNGELTKGYCVKEFIDVE